MVHCLRSILFAFLLAGCVATTAVPGSITSSEVLATDPTRTPVTPAATHVSQPSCAVTAYSRERPPDAHTAAFSSTWYGNADLWAGLAPPYQGEWYAGSSGLKVLWYRVQPGAPLTITGRRLDAPAPPLEAHVPEGYDGYTQSSGLTFPSEGCWEVTGTVNGKRLQFTVLVHPAAEHPIT